MADDIKKIEIMESVYAKNDKLAAEFNKKLTIKKIFCVNVMGSPGTGKTSTLIRIIEKIDAPVLVIEGDIESDIDAKKLSELGIRTVQINTGGACHLDAYAVAEAFDKTGARFSDGFLFIENIGNLVCPAEFRIGEHANLLVCSVTDGSDKPYKYPLAFEKADMILLNKYDLIDHVDFDAGFFTNGVKKLNGCAPVVEFSAKNGRGAEEVSDWLIKTAKDAFA